MTHQNHQYLTTREVADHYRVSLNTVCQWIKSGAITAINVSQGKRPTYRILASSMSQPIRNAAKGPAARPPGLKSYLGAHARRQAKKPQVDRIDDA